MTSGSEEIVELLGRLSLAYGDIAAYADGLMVLREDLRDPELRARGARWGEALASAIEAENPQLPEGTGRVILAQWQGILLWWGFAPDRPVEKVVRDELTRFLQTLQSPA